MKPRRSTRSKGTSRPVPACQERLERLAQADAFGDQSTTPIAPWTGRGSDDSRLRDRARAGPGEHGRGLSGVEPNLGRRVALKVVRSGPSAGSHDHCASAPRGTVVRAGAARQRRPALPGWRGRRLALHGPRARARAGRWSSGSRFPTRPGCRRAPGNDRPGRDRHPSRRIDPSGPQALEHPARRRAGDPTRAGDSPRRRFRHRLSLRRTRREPGDRALAGPVGTPSRTWRRSRSRPIARSSARRPMSMAWARSSITC